MIANRRWIALVGVLVIVFVLLAWADSTVLRGVFPSTPRPRPEGARAFDGPRGPGPFIPGLGRIGFYGIGRVNGIFTFSWFLATGAGVLLLSLAVLVVFPRRVRTAMSWLEAGSGLATALLAGVAAVLLFSALTVVLRAGLTLLPVVPLMLVVVLGGVIFGVACLALALGRWLARFLRPAHPLVSALAGLLAIFDAALVPYAGWVVLALAALAGLGLTVMTRFGSSEGWGLEDLWW